MMIDWLKHSVSVFGLSAPCWAYLAMGLGVVAEGAMGRSKRPEFRSLAALVANGLRLLLTFLRVPSIPVVGPLVVHLLEVAANVDLDGDGRIADRTPPPSSPPAAVVLLLALALPALSCAHFKPIVTEFGDCAGPEVEKACAELRPRVIAALSCSGLEAAALPGCALAELADLARDHGRVVVGCVMVAIRDAFKAGPAETADQRNLRARAGEWLQREEARGLRLGTRPSP